MIPQRQGSAADSKVGDTAGIWNNGVGLKIERFRADGILTIEPEESRSIL